MTKELIDRVGLPAFASPFTFFRSPWTQELDGADIVFFGNSWDYTGYWDNGGVRHAPGAVRQRSCAMDAFQNDPGQPFYPFHFNVKGAANMIDYGDVQWGVMPYYMDEWERITKETVWDIVDAGARPLMVGGDHTIAVPMMRALGDRFDDLACIHIDAHHDHQPFDEGLHSGALMWAGVFEGLINPDKTIGIGYRGAMNHNRLDDFEFLWGHDCVRLGPTRVAEIVRQKVGAGPVYLTFDIDVFSSETIDGTSTLMPGGPNFHFIQGLLYNLQGVNLVGADISELNPLTAGQGTTHATAAVAIYLAHLMAISAGHADPQVSHDFG